MDGDAVSFRIQGQTHVADLFGNELFGLTCLVLVDIYL